MRKKEGTQLSIGSLPRYEGFQIAVEWISEIRYRLGACVCGVVWCGKRCSDVCVDGSNNLSFRSVWIYGFLLGMVNILKKILLKAMKGHQF